jgi:hypothetical protein
LRQLSLALSVPDTAGLAERPIVITDNCATATRALDLQTKAGCARTVAPPGPANRVALAERSLALQCCPKRPDRRCCPLTVTGPAPRGGPARDE